MFKDVRRRAAQMPRHYAASRMPMTSVSRYLFLYFEKFSTADGMMLPNSMMLPPATRTSAHPATSARTKTDIAGVSVNRRCRSGQSLNLANIEILSRQKQF
jgi:hypothetical protein